MSKLIELIERLGQQSAQPIGFGALTGRVESPPAMALIGSTAASESASLIASGLPDGVDAIVFSDSDARAVLDAAGSGIQESTVWGATVGSLSNDDLNALIEAGCDYVLVEASAPAGVVGHPDLGTIVTTGEPVDRLTGAALRSLKVDGSLNTSGTGTGGMNFGTLVNVVKVGASIGGVMLVQAREAVSGADLMALRDAGVDGLVVPLEDEALVKQLVESIRELPPRRKSEARGLSPSAPRNED